MPGAACSALRWQGSDGAGGVRQAGHCAGLHLPLQGGVCLVVGPTRRTAPVPPALPRSMLLGDADGEHEVGGVPAAPSQRITPYLSRVAALRPATAAKAHTPQSGGKFAERANAGSVVASFNTHLELPAAEAEGEAMEVDGGAAAGSGGSGQLEVEVLGQPLGAGAKYMVDRLEGKVGPRGRALLAGVPLLLLGAVAELSTTTFCMRTRGCWGRCMLRPASRAQQGCAAPAGPACPA